jgi:hypothetical protein
MGPQLQMHNMGAAQVGQNNEYVSNRNGRQVDDKLKYIDI